MPTQHEWSMRLRAIGLNGLENTTDVFSVARYQQVLALAEAMLHEASHSEASATGVYAAFSAAPQTPKTGVRGAVFRDGKLLLVRERRNGLWTLPGGFCDVWDTPAQAITREIEEEAGFVVRVRKLFGVYDRDVQGQQPKSNAFTMFYFLCDIVGVAERDETETDAVGFFSADALPPLDLSKNTPTQVLRAFYHQQHPQAPTDFD